MAKIVAAIVLVIAGFVTICALMIAPPGGDPVAVVESATIVETVAEPSSPPLPADDKVETSADFELPQEKQERIWEAEHVTFEIEARLGGRLKSGIRAGNLDAIAATLRDDFHGQLVSLERGSRRAHAGIEEMHLSASDETQPELKRTEFVDGLGDVVSRFASCSSTGLRVLKLSKFDEHTWLAELLLTIGGRSPEGELLEFESHAAARFEFVDEDELETSPVIAEWAEHSRTLRSRARHAFEEVTEAWGLADAPIDDNWELPKEDVVQYRFQMAVADFDLDGRLDIAVATKHNSLLLRWDQQASKYVDATRAVGLPQRHTPTKRPAGRLHATQTPVDLAGWIDYDNDGYPDLVLGNRLYHNEDGQRFRDVTFGSGLHWGLQSMGVLVADYDADGLLDLYILEQATHETMRRRTTPLRWVNDDDYGEPNQLWRNLGEGRFENVTLESGAGGGRRHSLAATWFFYDDDHFPDLYVANDFNENVLLRNRGDGTFEDVSEQSGTSDFATSMGVAAGDLDNNGTSDLYVANMFSKMGRRIIANVGEDDYPEGIFEQIQGSCAGNCLYIREPGAESFTEHGEEWGVHGVGWAYAPAMADFDNDGWLDLYATTGFLSFERGKPDG